MKVNFTAYYTDILVANVVSQALGEKKLERLLLMNEFKKNIKNVNRNKYAT